MIDWECLIKSCSEAFWIIMACLGYLVLGFIMLIAGIAPLYLIIYTRNGWWLLFYILEAFIFFAVAIYKDNLKERKVWDGKTPPYED